jgi:hypothetical protein
LVFFLFVSTIIFFFFYFELIIIFLGFDVLSCGLRVDFTHIFRQLLHELSASSMSTIKVVDVSTGSAFRLQIFLFHIHSSFGILAFLTKQIFLNESIVCVIYQLLKREVTYLSKNFWRVSKLCYPLRMDFFSLLAPNSAHQNLMIAI